MQHIKFPLLHDFLFFVWLTALTCNVEETLLVSKDHSHNFHVVKKKKYCR